MVAIPCFFYTFRLIAQAAGFFIGLVSPLRKLMIGATAPLRAIEDSALLLGYDCLTFSRLLGIKSIYSLR